MLAWTEVDGYNITAQVRKAELLDIQMAGIVEPFWLLPSILLITVCVPRLSVSAYHDQVACFAHRLQTDVVLSLSVQQPWTVVCTTLMTFRCKASVP